MANKPNIVFMLGDNVGWGDLGCFGGLVPTPRLDKLASEGIRFTNFNTEAQCTPTRGALMTGRMPIRTGTFRVPLPGEPVHYGLSPWEYTLANLLSDAGYATACFGKWHIGNAPGRVPTDQGFDEWWGISESSDEADYTSHPMYPPEFKRPKIKASVKGQPVEEVDDFNRETRPFMDEKITEKTIDFIRRNAAEDKPFYVYVPFTNVHPPMIPHPDFQNATQSSKAAPKNIAELDYRAGQILDTLDELGLAEDTIVVWASDNAAGTLLSEPMGSSGFWRGTFGGGWEGSMRTPAMVRWPGHIPTSVVTDEIVATYDWYPTLAALAGVGDRVPTDRPFDGLDMSAFMLGQSETSGREHFVYMGSDGEPISAKWKTFKVHFRYTDSTSWIAPYIKPQIPMVCDLISDPHETIDLMQSDLTYGWVIGAAMAPLFALAKSAAKFRHVQVGEEDFNGYD
jgi:arylsulfatase A-like enzyme